MTFVRNVLAIFGIFAVLSWVPPGWFIVPVMVVIITGVLLTVISDFHKQRSQ